MQSPISKASLNQSVRKESESQKSIQTKSFKVLFYKLLNEIKGLSYIVNTKVHLARRAFWTMVFVLGITQSILMMIGNGQRFYKVLIRDLKSSSHFTLVPLYNKVDRSGQCRVPKSHHLPELYAL